jgi:hypothetical protein
MTEEWVGVNDAWKKCDWDVTEARRLDEVVNGAWLRHDGSTTGWKEDVTKAGKKRGWAMTRARSRRDSSVREARLWNDAGLRGTWWRRDDAWWQHDRVAKKSWISRDRGVTAERRKLYRGVNVEWQTNATKPDQEWIINVWCDQGTEWPRRYVTKA